MSDLYYVLDASAFINGFEPKTKYNFTVSEITDEVKDLKSRIMLNQAIDEGKIIIREVSDDFLIELDRIIADSGDDLRLSEPDKNLLALALSLLDEGKNIKVVTDDYSMQNVLKILEIPYSSIITDGIKGVYNWVKTCEGCKKEYPSDYPYEDCEICGSRIFKRRIKT
ncbi:ribonuclease VapC [uncultured Methanobrevibacter sp.]|uniref:ribonuclease VapC n=1 Tax=uncultured Methanobrevibacter sp. TaxID=253161 RepID=UPI00261A4639